MMILVSVLVLSVAVWIFFFLSPSAYAYLDPGSGSMVLQVLLGGVAALGVLIKLFWHRILNVLGIRKEETEDQSEADSTPNSPKA
jgi:hypothetical protein